LIHPARGRDQHEPERIENAHPSTVSRVISATTRHSHCFSAFEFLDTRDDEVRSKHAGAGRARSRALKALGRFLLALAPFGLLAWADVGWFDALHPGLVVVISLALSARTLFSKWRCDDGRDGTRYEPLAAYPASWRRWLRDDYPSAKRS
jgi:hypothetical protein